MSNYCVCKTGVCNKMHILSPCSDSSRLYTVVLLEQYSTEGNLTKRENITFF